MKLCALSVDLDEIHCYHAIHGLAAPSGPTAHAVYATAVPRYLQVLSDLGVPCTFFVIGQDLGDDVAIASTLALRDAGHELANHTQHHRYDFVRLSPPDLRAEIIDANRAVQRVTGILPVGFRAPGYTITDEVFDALADLGMVYDTSVFPCPVYWAGKAVFITGTQILGRRSRSIVDTPAVLAAPADPYLPGRPYWRRGTEDSVVELPVGVTRLARLPYIGTSLMLAGPSRVDWLTAQIVGRPLVNLELHGLDLLDQHDGLTQLRAYQRDLSVPVAVKTATLRRVVNDLRTQGYRFVTLREAAEAVRASAASAPTPTR